MSNTLVLVYLICAMFTSHLSGNIPPSSSILNQVSAAAVINDYIKQTAINDEKLDYVEELKKLGYYKQDSQDLKLNIRNAVIRFQADHNLNVDGDWGKVPLGTLKKRLKNSKYEYSDTVKTPPTKGKWILINKSMRILTLYENNGVIKKFPVAVGNPPELTPQGQFKIVTKVIDPTWGGGGYAEPINGGDPNNPLGHRWMGLSPNNGNSYGIHGNSDPFSIGTYASHGCIRMINSDSEELYDLVSLETPVWICTDAILGEWGITQTEYLSCETS